ncbi:MAG TPA: hypothetical protein V6D19_20745 [Stenomitos sp.]
MNVKLKDIVTVGGIAGVVMLPAILVFGLVWHQHLCFIRTYGYFAAAAQSATRLNQNLWENTLYSFSMSLGIGLIPILQIPATDKALRIEALPVREAMTACVIAWSLWVMNTFN